MHAYLTQHPGVTVFSQCVVTSIGRDFVTVFCAEFGIEERIYVFSNPMYEYLR